MATRGTVSTPTYSSDSANSKQTNGSEGISLDDPIILAILTVVACIHEDDIDIDNPGRKRRCLSPWRQNEKVKKKHLQPGRMKGVLQEVTEEKNYSDGGWHIAWIIHRHRLWQFDEYWLNLGKRRQDLLTIEDLELVIANFISQLEAEDATNANEANYRSKLNTLLQLQRFKKEKINGEELQQIMKKPQVRMRKPINEEYVWNYDQLLKYIKSKSDQKMQLSEIEFLGIVIAIIMGYSTLRLIEVHRSMVLKLPKGFQQVKTAMFKGHDTSVTDMFRRAALYEETSKAVHIVMKACKIQQDTQSPRSNIPH
ncbi:MAG: hypothetical protein EZS28_035867 [Streblomastix strix]|uniref:Uncharacterized protein n=1 Tax=Streblomastix strix TaxID=222440 RepID=A0A5J4UDV3_9EUKA|nr:MAG: hypothetical protein EZS28_035867 [Streblomastix strix]